MLGDSVHDMICCRQEKIDFWDNVYGFDMSSIKERALIEPLVDNVDPEQICTSSCQMKTIDILDMRVEDANFEVCTHSQTSHSCLMRCMLCVGKQSLTWQP